MTRRVTLGAALALVAVVAGTAAAQEKGKKAPRGGYVHVVVFRLKKDAPADAVEKVIADCHKMLGKISAVRSVKAGRPAEKGTPDLAKKNYDLALLVLVDDHAGLRSYLEDPIHLQFVEKYGKYFDMQKMEVFDFANQKK